MIKLVSLPHSHVRQLSRYHNSQQNTPEEDDETMSTEEREASVVPKPDSTTNPDGHRTPPEHAAFPDDPLFSRQRPDREQEYKHNHTLPHPGLSYFSYHPPRSLPAGYSQPTPFPSQANGAWLHPSFASSWSGYPNSLPSSLGHKDFSSCTGDSCLSGCKSLSLPAGHSTSMSSLEQPFSLCSNPPSANLYHHTLPPYSCSPKGAACCAQCPADAFNRGPLPNNPPWPQYHPAYGPYCKSKTVYHPDTGTYWLTGAVNYSSYGRRRLACNWFFSFSCIYCFSSSWLQTSWSWLHTNVSCWTHFGLFTHVACFWTVIKN